jgi:hypothetical protein
MSKTDEHPPLAYTAFNDLRQALPLVASLLSKSANPEKIADLVVINAEHTPRRYMADEAYRDKVITVHGVVREFPYISLMRPDEDEGRIPGWGVILYEAKPELRYTVFCVPDPHDWGRDFRCYVLWKKDKAAFRKHIREQDAKTNRINKAPVLSPGMLEEIVENTFGFLERAKEMEAFGVRIVRGILLDGKPGNGKTMICKWLRKLCIDQNINWGNVTSSEIEKWYESGSPLHELFTRHTVTFFDDFDVDMMGSNKGKDILTAMDGMEDTFHRVRIFTTNSSLEGVDEAFFRPGRLDACFTIEPPTREMRGRLVDNVWPDPIREHINEPGRMERFLDSSEKFSFADLEAIRATMVKQHVMDGAEWNQDTAFQTFNESRRKRRRVGFK